MGWLVYPELQEAWSRRVILFEKSGVYLRLFMGSHAVFICGLAAFVFVQPSLTKQLQTRENMFYTMRYPGGVPAAWCKTAGGGKEELLSLRESYSGRVGGKVCPPSFNLETRELPAPVVLRI